MFLSLNSTFEPAVAERRHALADLLQRGDDAHEERGAARDARLAGEVRLVDGELVVRERGEDARLVVGRAARLRAFDQLDLLLVLREVLAHDRAVLLEVAAALGLREELAHALLDLAEVLDHLAEQRDVARRAVLAGEVAHVAGEHEVRARGLHRELLERRADLLRAGDRLALRLVELEALRRGVANAREVGALRGARDLVDLLDDRSAALDHALHLSDVTSEARVTREVGSVFAVDLLELLAQVLDEVIGHG